MLPKGDRMRTGQRKRMITEARDLITQLATEHARAIDRLDEFSGGYPSGGNGQGSSTVDDGSDDTGNPIDYSDRTGHLATSPDPSREAIARFDRLLEDAVRGLRNAQQITREALSAGRSVASIPGCVSCARGTDHRGRPVHVNAWRSGLCQWCSSFQSGHGIWPPLPVLKAHHDGVYVTARVAERIMEAHR